MDTKIIQITSEAYVNIEGATFIKIFGLGDDNKVYEWEASQGEWSLALR